MSRESRAFTARERDLIEKSESALRDGRQLLHWWRERAFSKKIKTFPLIAPLPSVTMTGFFDELTINGKQTSVMGCVQAVRAKLPRAAGRAAIECSLDQFSRRDLFRITEWRNPDGLPGGFGYTPRFFKAKQDGQYGRFDNGLNIPDMDLSEIGKGLDWIMLQVDLHDFARCFKPPGFLVKPLSRMVREAAYLVADEEFLQCNMPGTEGALSEHGLGYSFVPATVHPNFFGFGPGRFGAALKLFQFCLLPEETFEIQLAFLAAPRSQKVLYLGGFDPVYGFFHLMNALTLGGFHIKERIHDKLDTVMLRQHGDVHQSFVEGVLREMRQQNWVVSGS
jgi:hypothetical protein